MTTNKKFRLNDITSKASGVLKIMNIQLGWWRYKTFIVNPQQIRLYSAL